MHHQPTHCFLLGPSPDTLQRNVLLDHARLAYIALVAHSLLCFVLSLGWPLALNLCVLSHFVFHSVQIVAVLEASQYTLPNYWLPNLGISEHWRAAFDGLMSMPISFTISCFRLQFFGTQDLDSRDLRNHCQQKKKKNNEAESFLITMIFGDDEYNKLPNTDDSDIHFV